MLLLMLGVINTMNKIVYCYEFIFKKSQRGSKYEYLIYIDNQVLRVLCREIEIGKGLGVLGEDEFN